MQILIVARLPIIREGLRALLSIDPQLQITTLPPSSEGTTTENILDARPDVVLLDADVLDEEGWLLLQDLRQLAPGLHVLVLTAERFDRRAAQALALGAHGYLLREASPEQLTASIRAVSAGLYVLDASLAGPLLERPPRIAEGDEDSERPSAPSQFSDSSALVEPLSERERAVLQLLTRGLANKQIAAQLFISEHTVKFHIRSILSKLGASNRTEAVTLALQKGLVTL